MGCTPIQHGASPVCSMLACDAPECVLSMGVSLVGFSALLAWLCLECLRACGTLVDGTFGVGDCPPCASVLH